MAGLGYEVFKLATAETDAQKAQDAYTASIVKAGDKMADVNIEVDKMTTLFDQAKKGVASKTDALNEYNKTFGDSLGKAKDFNQAENIFVQKTGAYIQVMNLRAQADAAYALEKEQLKKLIEEQATGEITTFQKIKAGFIGAFTGLDGALVKSVEFNLDNQKETKKLADNYKNVGENAEAAAAAIAKANKINLIKPPETHDNSLAEQKKFIDESQKIEEDAEQKAITEETIRYEKIKADLIKNHHDTELLTTQHYSNIEAIRNEFDNKRFAKAQEGHAKRQKEIEEADKKAADHLRSIETLINDHYNKDENLGVSARQKALNDADLFYQKEKTALAGHDKELEALEKLHTGELAKINKEYDDKALADDNKKNQSALKHIQDITKRDNSDRLTKLKNQKTELDNSQKLLDQFYQSGAITQEEYTEKTNALSQARQQTNKLEMDAYADYGEQIGGTLSKLGDALGEQTQVGKDISIAGSIISTISGAIKAFDSLADIPIIGPELGIAAAAAALVAGYENVKKIEAVKVPGATGTSSNTISNSAASIPGGAVTNAPNIPQAVNSTTLSPQSVNQIGAINRSTAQVRAYVVESDITNSQNRQAGFRNQNSLGRRLPH